MRRRQACMIALSAAVALGACSGGKAKTKTTTTTSSTTTSTTTTTAPPPPTAGAPTTCQVGQVSAALTALDAGAGQRYANLVFTNTSPTPCTMFGYPGFGLLTNGGAATLPTDVVRTTNAPNNTVTLAANGGQAFTTLHWSVISGPDEPQDVQCQPNPDMVQITPPDEGDFLVIPWTLGYVCEQGRIEVNPVQPGAGP